MANNVGGGALAEGPRAEEGAWVAVGAATPERTTAASSGGWVAYSILENNISTLFWTF